MISKILSTIEWLETCTIPMTSKYYPYDFEDKEISHTSNSKCTISWTMMWKIKFNFEIYAYVDILCT